jgi:hypothetical protein
MMMAGDLLVTVHGLRETEGNLLVRLKVGDQKQQTNIHWSSADNADWDEQINFYQVRVLLDYSLLFFVGFARASGFHS